jgi:peptide-methionine (S)-S-oxide reductase
MMRKTMVFTAMMALSVIVGVSCRAQDGTEAAPPAPEGYEVATFAGGCFWCMEKPFEVIDGVVSVTSGYTGGHKEHPTYKEVGSGRTGHAEAVRIVFDPQTVTYEELLEVYWRNIDPTTPDRQFCDAGFQYRPEIFYHDEMQLRAAEKSKQDLIKSGRVARVEVRISPASTFYVAEDYHQDFYQTNPEHYERYRMGCGRDRRLEELWGESEQ